MSNPHNRIALITGAGTGIGKACAVALLHDGWRVVFAGRRQQLLDVAIASAGDPFGDIAQRAVGVSADMTQPASVAALFDTLMRRFGRLDVIFNNAGTNVPATNFGDLTWSAWKKVIDVNLNGMFLCASGAFRLMQRQQPQGGRIINNGSISAHAPRPGSAPYTSSKHAITGLTKSISLDGRQFDIACGQIDIGNAASHMTERMAAGVPQADGTIKPEPTMDVAHVANAVVHMADLPPDANVQFMTIMSTKMPFVGRG
jgi:NAD(P)-dependent dehydrogenase (short-subunit alcohol dehydrogenase family)